MIDFKTIYGILYELKNVKEYSCLNLIGLYHGYKGIVSSYEDCIETSNFIKKYIK